MGFSQNMRLAVLFAVRAVNTWQLLGSGKYVAFHCSARTVHSQRSVAQHSTAQHNSLSQI